MAEKDRVRTEQFRFTLLPEENAMLTKNAFEYGLSKSEYLRKLILAESLTGKQWHMDRDQAKQLIYEVNRIGNNVNQIAYNTNAVRFSSSLRRRDPGSVDSVPCSYPRTRNQSKVVFHHIAQIFHRDLILL